MAGASSPQGSKSEASGAPPPAPGFPPLNQILEAASVHAASLAVLNAVQHLQRTSVLVETAAAVSLVRVLSPGAAPDEAWAEALKISRQSMAEAMEIYRQALNAAIDLGKTISP
jgi:hypothetical protein